MKYWNKGKKVRDKHWYTVVIPIDKTSKKMGGVFGIKRILSKINSPGKFFIQSNDPSPLWALGPDEPNITIWFQNEKDSVFFKLKYS